jgi:hypothetical protein
VNDLAAMRKALEDAGVIFIDEDGCEWRGTSWCAAYDAARGAYNAHESIPCLFPLQAQRI